MKQIQLLAALLCCFACATPTRADIFFFGDSLTDSGNFFNLSGLPPAPYSNGRLSNGPTWAEVYSERLGTSAVASSKGGTNYAYASSRTGPSRPPFNLSNQVDAYIADGARGNLHDLFVVWAGSNDIFDAVKSNDPTAGIATALLNVGNSISTLQANGARQFLVLNSVPLGQTPFYQALGVQKTEALNNLSASYNQGLSAQLSMLEIALGIDIHEVDMYALFEDIKANPAAAGLSNVDDSVTPFSSVTGLASDFPTDDPETFLFWDGIHPTAAGHRLIANRVFTASVPEPSAVGLLMAIGIALCFRRKTRPKNDINLFRERLRFFRCERIQWRSKP